MTLQPKIYGNFRKTEKRPKSRAYRQDPEHLAFVRSLPCCITGRTENVVAHHLLSVPGSRGVGMKAEDWWTVPLCAEVHNRLHHVDQVVADTEELWFIRQGVVPHVLARRLWNNSGDRELGEWAVSRRERMR